MRAHRTRAHSLACLLAVEEALEASEPDEAAAAAARPRIVAELGDPQMEELLHARFGRGAKVAARCASRASKKQVAGLRRRVGGAICAAAAASALRSRVGAA